jgi:SAM-dependent methyltransferase
MSTIEELSQPRGNYSKLVQSGHYGEMPTGLWGKFDNVRRFWENQTTRFALRPAILRIVRQCIAREARVRVADLGCGSGEGWDLLMQIPADFLELGKQPHVLKADHLEVYHGVDLCPQMVQEASRKFHGNSKTRFEQCDLTQPDNLLSSTPGFDVYFSSYGSLSHLDDSQLADLLAKLSRHAQKSSIIVLDLLGQFSVEWPGYWGYSAKDGFSPMQPYSMTWLYSPNERRQHRLEFSDYRIRYWGGAELKRFLRSIPGLSGRIRNVSCTDRSILIGRHVDTSEFNDNAKPLRQAVNALFEFNCHPATSDLRAPEIPRSQDPEITSFYAKYRSVWNGFVDVYRAAMSNQNASGAVDRVLLNHDLHPNLSNGLRCIGEQAQLLSWLQPGDPLGNALQPQFGLLLRNLEFQMQQGLGCGHGLIAVIELD